jgi:hypothetical protein
MNSLSHINLLKESAILSPELIQLETSIKKISTLVMIAAVALTLVVGVIFVIFSVRSKSLNDQKLSLLQRISLQAEKEVLVGSIKDRLRLIESVSATETQWDTILQSIFDVAVPPALSSVTLGIKNDVSVTVSAPTIEDVKQVIDTVVGLAQEKRITKPTMSALTVSENGTVRITLAFTVVAL